MEFANFIIVIAGILLNLARFSVDKKKGVIAYVYIIGNVFLIIYFGYNYLIDRSEMIAINKAVKNYLVSDNYHYKIYDEIVSKLGKMGFDESKYSRSIVELMKDGVIDDCDVILYDTKYSVSHNCRGYYIK